MQCKRCHKHIKCKCILIEWEGRKIYMDGYKCTCGYQKGVFNA